MGRVWGPIVCGDVNALPFFTAMMTEFHRYGLPYTGPKIACLRDSTKWQELVPVNGH